MLAHVVRMAEVQQLLQPPLAPADPSLTVGQLTEGRDGRQVPFFHSGPSFHT